MTYYLTVIHETKSRPLPQEKLQILYSARAASQSPNKLLPFSLAPPQKKKNPSPSNFTTPLMIFPAYKSIKLGSGSGGTTIAASAGGATAALGVSTPSGGGGP